MTWRSSCIRLSESAPSSMKEREATFGSSSAVTATLVAAYKGAAGMGPPPPLRTKIKIVALCIIHALFVIVCSYGLF